MIYRQTLIALGAVFFCVVVLTWANEYYHLPYWLLGAPKSDPSWQEALLETSFVFIAAVASIAYVIQYERKTRYLKRFQHICAECHKVRVGNSWKDLEEFLRTSTNVVVSHAICPLCLKKNHPDEYRRLVALGMLDPEKDILCSTHTSTDKEA